MGASPGHLPHEIRLSMFWLVCVCEMEERLFLIACDQEEDSQRLACGV